MRRFLTLGFCLVPAVAHAAGGGGLDPFRASLQMIAALGVVLGIVLLLFYLLRRRNLGPFGQPRGGAIRVLETRCLGPRKSLCLVQVRGEDLLLGICQDRIELLARPAAGTFPAALDAAREEQR